MSENRLVAGFQLYDNMMQMGYDHIVVRPGGGGVSGDGTHEPLLSGFQSPATHSCPDHIWAMPTPLQLMSTEENCKRALRAWPQVSCIWSSQVGGMRLSLVHRAKQAAWTKHPVCNTPYVL